MITELRISNFRSLGKDVLIKPQALSIFVGPNGSGKSNTLEAIAFLREAVVSGLPPAVTRLGGIDSVRRRSTGHPFNVEIVISLNLPSGQASYGFELTGDRIEEYRVKAERADVQHRSGRWSFRRTSARFDGPPGLAPRVSDDSLILGTLGADERFQPLVDALASVAIYKIFPDTLARPQIFDQARPMRPHGENWVSVLREAIRDHEVKNELVMGLKKLTSDIDDIRVERAAEYLVAEFKQSSQSRKAKRWFSAGQQSDGTLRFAGILTALLQRPPLAIVGIEEPELTVHPGALPLLFDFLRQASTTSQILVTTHSPILLDVADPSQDGIFVVERRDAVTQVERVSDKMLQPVQDRLLTLGELYVAGGLQLDLFDEDAA